MRALSFMLFFVVLTTAAEDFPFVPFPDDVAINVVGENLTVYGLPLMAYEYYVREKPERAAEYYKKVWQEKADEADVAQPFMETRIGRWMVLSRLERGHNITVQFGDAGLKGTQVLVGISPLPEFLLSERKNQIKINMPRLGDVKFASIVASQDKGKMSEVYWIESSDTVDVLLSRYKRHFESEHANIRGYRIIDNQANKANYGSLIVDAKKAHYRFEAIRGDDQKTRVIASWQPH